MTTDSNPEDIQQRMNALRSTLDDDVAQVATSVRAKTDWRYYVQNYPWLVAGAATAVGFVIVPRRVEKVERIVPDADALAQLAKQEKLVMAPESQVKVGNNGGVLNALVAFALTAGSRAAMGYFSNQFGSMMDKVTAPEKEPAFAPTASRPK